MVQQEDDGEEILTPRRTTLVSIAAAALLVALKLGVGLATRQPGADLHRDRVERRCDRRGR